jgi:hypothetical protein
VAAARSRPGYVPVAMNVNVAMSISGRMLLVTVAVVMNVTVVVRMARGLRVNAAVGQRGCMTI